MIDYQSIKELKIVTDIEEINALISEGWRIISIAQDYEGFVLARCK